MRIIAAAVAALVLAGITSADTLLAEYTFNGTISVPSYTQCACPETVNFNFNLGLVQLPDPPDEPGLDTTVWVVEPGATVSSSGPLTMLDEVEQFETSENFVTFDDGAGDEVLLAVNLANNVPAIAYVNLYGCVSETCTTDFAPYSQGSYDNGGVVTVVASVTDPPVPEPATWLLLVIGAIGVIGAIVVKKTHRREVSDRAASARERGDAT